MGDIAPDVTDIQLMDEFKRYFPSVKGAKVSCSVRCVDCCAGLQRLRAVWHCFAGLLTGSQPSACPEALR